MDQYNKHIWRIRLELACELLIHIPPIILALLICGYQSNWAAVFADKYPQRVMWIGLLEKVFSISFLIIAAVVTLVFIGIKTYRQKHLRENLNSLKAENEKLLGRNEKLSEDLANYISQFEMLLNVVIKESAKKFLNLETTDRITIYIHSEDSDRGKGFFSKISRHSPNPIFKNSGRTQYPDDEGCISQAWKEGKCIEPKVFKSKKKGYAKADLIKYNMTAEKIRSLTMQSDYLAALRLPLSIHDKPIAVVVVESTIGNRFTEEQINEWIESQESFFVEFIRGLGDNIPTPLTAEKADF